MDERAACSARAEASAVLTHGTFWIGVMFELIGTLFGGALGAEIFHIGMTRVPRSKKLMALGIAMQVVFSVTCEGVALNYAPIMLLSPYGSTVVVFSALIHGARRGWRTVPWRGVAVMALGCAGAATYAPSVVPEFSSTERVVTFGLTGMIPVYTFMTESERMNAPARALAAGVVAGFTQSVFKATQHYGRRAAMGCASAVAPCVLTAILATAYACVQQYLYLSALATSDPIRVLPVYWLSILLSTLAVSGLMFGEFGAFSSSSTATTTEFFASLGLAAAGVWIVSSSASVASSASGTELVSMPTTTSASASSGDGDVSALAHAWRRAQAFSSSNRGRERERERVSTTTESVSSV